MTISILTLFPEPTLASLNYSILKRAQEKKLLTINAVNIRDFTTDSYKTVDDHPYGGGVGMVMRVDVIDRALQGAKRPFENTYGKHAQNAKQRSVLLDPQGKTYNQARAKAFSKLDHLILICGHYEGVDERVRTLVDEEISIGDYILTGGEIPAMVLVDSITRLIPGVLKDVQATQKETFSENLLEYPQYTRPDTYKTMSIPEVLLSGNHAKITKWRDQEAHNKTLIRRPDLIKEKKDRS